ncbi:MAG TPA: GNAT family N-acetyltransferase [Gaiellaceae bacterium]
MTRSRAFSEGDLQLLLELEQELSRSDPATVGHGFGQIAFWSAQLTRDDWEARLWFDDEELAGWGWLSGTELEAEVRPTRRELLEEILDWGRPETMIARPDDADLVARLCARGLVHDPHAPWWRSNERSLGRVEVPRVPAGYALRTMAEGVDTESRSACHRAAFHPSRFTDATYGVVRAAWPYRADLDCVVVAPDGSVAAYALAWLDDANAVGELEPVGTHPDHQRRGLGRAVCLFALERLREQGATTALVACRGDRADPVACRLYESIGFREDFRTVTFMRELGSDPGQTRV